MLLDKLKTDMTIHSRCPDITICYTEFSFRTHKTLYKSIMSTTKLNIL